MVQIAKENNLGEISISAINNGRMWRTDREYPIRKKPVPRTITRHKITTEKENKKIKKMGTS